MMGNRRWYILLWIVLSAVLSACGGTAGLSRRNLIRLDKDGYLYYLDYTGDYYSQEVIDSLERVGFI